MTDWTGIPDLVAAREALDRMDSYDADLSLAAHALDEIERLRSAAIKGVTVEKGGMIVVPLSMVPEGDEATSHFVSMLSESLKERLGHADFLIVLGDLDVIPADEAKRALERLAART